MPVNITASLKKALRQLEVEKDRIDTQIAAVQAALETLGNTRGTTRISSTHAKGKRHRMSAAGRPAVSLGMRAYWAKRKASSAKSKAKEAAKGQ